MATYAPKLSAPSASDFYLVEWHFADQPGVHHYNRWHYSAEFGLWNSWATTKEEAARDAAKGTIGGSDELVITGWTLLGDRGLANIFKEIIYAGPNHV